jgi:hypothetical protein
MDADPQVSAAAAAHCRLRFEGLLCRHVSWEVTNIGGHPCLGYYKRHLAQLDPNRVLLDVIIIAKEADRQLEEL